MMLFRKKFKLAFPDDNIDLRDYGQEIVDAINRVAPGKHPQVFKDHYSTDMLTQSESVKIGRELAGINELKKLGRQITTFRLFEGKLYSSEASNVPIKKDTIKNNSKGGHL